MQDVIMAFIKVFFIEKSIVVHPKFIVSKRPAQLEPEI